MNATLTVDRDPNTHKTSPPPSKTAQLFGVAAGPILWNAQIITGYAVSSYPCFSGGVSRAVVLPGWEHSWIAPLIVTLAAIVITAIAFAVGWRAASWARAQSFEDELRSRVVARTRAMGIAGMLTSALFILATVFSLIALLGTPQCSG